tara:strand:- start:1 stop:648 length:648 start_codon:yes stop_codon:yes gene_type:complete
MINVLVLAAHADDETLGAGGYLAKLAMKGAKIDLVVMSDCKITVRNNLIDNSLHLKKASKVLGIQRTKILAFKDQKFDTYSIADLANSVLKLNIKPDLILTHSKNDLNKDHRITLEVAKIIGRPKSKQISILSFEIPNNNTWNARPFAPNYFVDISKTIKKKLLAFSKYKNETKPFPHPLSIKGLELIAKYRGFQSGYKFAEAYEIIRAYEKHLF